MSLHSACFWNRGGEDERKDITISVWYSSFNFHKNLQPSSHWDVTFRERQRSRDKTILGDIHDFEKEEKARLIYDLDGAFENERRGREEVKN
jgi:hypothetical protein